MIWIPTIGYSPDFQVQRNVPTVRVQELPVLTNYVATLWIFLTQSVIGKTFRISKYSLSKEHK